MFRPTGRLLGTLRLPRNFEVFEIGADYVLGLARDDNDVETVELYRLERSK